MHTKRVFYLDFIRAFACISILIIHFNAAVSGYDNGVFVYSNSVFPNYIFNGVYLGGFGVSLFFILSGATLMTVYKDGCPPIFKFYKKRFLSIYPMFWLAFIISISCNFLVNKYVGQAPLYYLIFSALGIDGNLFAMGITGFGFYQLGEWFLGCIIGLYLVYPLLSYLFKKIPVIFTISIILLYGICNFYFHVNSSFFVVRIPEFVLGMIFAKYYMKHKLSWHEVLISFCVGAVAWVLSKHIDALSYQIIISACAFVILVYFAQFIKSQKTMNLFSGISKYTYAAFLVHHQLVFYLIKGLNLASLPKRQLALLFFIYLVTTGGLAVMIFKINAYIILNVKHAFIKS